MKTTIAILTLIMATLGVRAATTINTVNRMAYTANLGWLDAHSNTATGAVIGEYDCSG